METISKIVVYLLNVCVLILSDMIRLGDDPTGGYRDHLFFSKLIALFGVFTLLYYTTPSNYRLFLFTSVHILLTSIQYSIISRLTNARSQKIQKEWEQLKKDCNENPQLTKCRDE